MTDTTDAADTTDTTGTTTDQPAAPPFPTPPPQARPPTPPPAQPLLPVPPELDEASPARLVLWAIAGGVALELGIRGGLANGAVALGLLVLVGALLTDGRVARPSSRALVALAALPAACLALRVSPWLVGSNLLAVTTLVGLAILQSRSGSLFDTTAVRLIRRSTSAIWRAFWASTLLWRLVPRNTSRAAQLTQRAGRIGVALLIAVPMLGAVVLFLASADPVFAGMVSPDVNPGPTLGHLVLGGLFAFGIMTTVAAALGDGDDGDHRGRFGITEVATMLSLAATVLALFVVAQLVALTEAGDRLVEEAGLTPAEYARSGFFQLCWATAFLLAFLSIVSFLADRDVLASPPIRVLSALVPLLAVGLVVVSLRRMALYDDAFGLTMLRLWVVGAAVWMGAVLLMVAARNAGMGGGRQWVLGGSVVLATALVVLANLANPEARIVHHNIARGSEGKPLDLEYLASLSDDAVPAMVHDLGPDAFAIETDRGYLQYDLDAPMRCSDESTGVAALNWSVARAADARDLACNGDAAAH
jgi:hypothetical protein